MPIVELRISLRSTSNYIGFCLQAGHRGRRPPGCPVQRSRIGAPAHKRLAATRRGLAGGSGDWARQTRVAPRGNEADPPPGQIHPFQWPSVPRFFAAHPRLPGFSCPGLVPEPSPSLFRMTCEIRGLAPFPPPRRGSGGRLEADPFNGLYYGTARLAKAWLYPESNSR